MLMYLRDCVWVNIMISKLKVQRICYLDSYMMNFNESDQTEHTRRPNSRKPEDMSKKERILEDIFKILEEKLRKAM